MHSCGFIAKNKNKTDLRKPIKPFLILPKVGVISDDNREREYGEKKVTHSEKN